MKQINGTLLICLIMISACAQPLVVKHINETNTPELALAPLRFLASDELMGRSTTRPEIHIAARYISEEFRSFGLRKLEGLADYYQSFDIKLNNPKE